MIFEVSDISDIAEQMALTGPPPGSDSNPHNPAHIVTDRRAQRHRDQKHQTGAAGGYLRNLQEGKRTAQYVIGEAMPEDAGVLPTAKAVAKEFRTSERKKVKAKAKKPK